VSDRTEEELVHSALRGDTAAFRELMRVHRQRMVSLIHRMLGPSGDVEDVAQEVYLHVHRSLGSFRGEARFSTWLYRLTANVVRMHIRRLRSRPRLVSMGAESEPVFERHDSGPSPAEGAERADRVAALYRRLDELSEKKRDVIVLHDLEGLPAAEIALIVDAPVLTVRTRLFYARKDLYELLAQEPAFAESEIADPETGSKAGE